MNKKQKKSALITYGMVGLGFIFCIILVEMNFMSRQLQSQLVPIGINIILAVSLNLVVGFLGELSLGHAGFMAVGAYAGGLAAIYMGSDVPALVRFPIAMIIGGLVAAAFGALIGIPVLRLQGDYLAIVTLAFGEIIRNLIQNIDVLGGAAGLRGVPQDASYITTFVVIFIVLFLLINLTNSRTGRAITAIRDNRIAAQSIGINVTYYKLLAFVISAFFAGVAGTIYAHNISLIEPNAFDYNVSIEILVMVVLGGLGSIRGSIIGAVLITMLPELLRGADDYRLLIYSVVLIAMMILNASPRFAEIRSKLNWGTLIDSIKKKPKKEAAKK